MMTFLSEFTTYLNNLGYECDATQAMMAERVICDLEQPDELCRALKSIYAKNPREFHAFDNDFADFFKRKDDRLKVIETRQHKRELSERKRVLEERRSVLQDQSAHALEKEDEIREKYRRMRDDLNIQKEKSFGQYLNEFRLKKIFNSTEENFLRKNEEYLKSHPLGKALKGEEPITDQLLKELEQKAELAALNGDLETFKKDNRIFKLARRMKNREKTTQRQASARVEEEYSEKEKQLALDEKKEIAALWTKIREEEEQIDEEVRRIKIALGKLGRREARLIQKTASLSHRDVFIGGKNAVQCASEGELSKSFDLLSDSELKRVYETVHQESVRLKTRLRKISQAHNRQVVDLKRTVRASIRTGGAITKLLYRKRKPSKADMVLMLDISGSCSRAAKMLIGFAYALKDAFPSGCRVYAFVNRLYDITDIMAADNVFEATQAVFNTIPTRGAYSNYNGPLESFWRKEKNRLGRESFVMIMGDARNNRNLTGEYYLQQIRRKCPHSYFLCTEEPEEWGSGDSIADLYSEIIHTVPVTNTSELLRFLETVE